MQIKVLTYNIQHGKGLDNKVSLQRIAEVIKNEDPDIVSINETDKHFIRTYFANQPAKLAKLTGMSYFYGNNMKFLLMEYGNLVLSKSPFNYAENINLPGLVEQRGVIKANLYIKGEKINFLCTHLGLTQGSRAQQIDRIKKTLYKSPYPVILAGDFNCNTNELSPLLEHMNITRGHFTFSSGNPQKAIDYILWTKEFELINSYTVNTDASDHLPLVAILKLKRVEK